MTPDTLTLTHILKFRRDLERRIQIDINQFEKDTGLVVSRVDLLHSHVMEEPNKRVARVQLDVELPNI